MILKNDTTKKCYSDGIATLMLHVKHEIEFL